jgi:hypothetical protein
MAWTYRGTIVAMAGSTIHLYPYPKPDAFMDECMNLIRKVAKKQRKYLYESDKPVEIMTPPSPKEQMEMFKTLHF